MLKHRSIWTWLSLAAAVAVLGGGLLAATTDAITSSGNSVDSNALTVLPGVDIQAAMVTSTTDCNSTDTADGAFTDGPLPAVITGTFDLDAAAPQVTSSILCFRNIGADDGIAVLNPHGGSILTEVTCEQSELDAGDDCDTAPESGELDVFLTGDRSTSCAMSGWEMTVPAGAYCDFQFDVDPVYFDANGSLTGDPTLAQTDAVSFDLTWTATVVAPEPPDCGDAGSEDPAAPQVIQVDTTESGTICDDDFYIVQSTEFTPGQQMQLDLTFTHSEGDLDVRVYDQSSNELGSAISTDDNETLVFQAPSEGDVLIWVQKIDGPSQGFSMIVLSTPTP